MKTLLYFKNRIQTAVKPINIGLTAVFYFLNCQRWDLTILFSFFQVHFLNKINNIEKTTGHWYHITTPVVIFYSSYNSIANREANSLATPKSYNI